MVKTAIIAHMLAGKTTLSKRYPSLFFDVDDLRTEELDALLKPLRRAADWQAHNAILYAHYRRLAPSIAAPFILCHNVDAGLALGAQPKGALVRDDAEMRRRAQSRGLDEAGIELAFSNRALVSREAALWNLRVNPWGSP